MKINAYVVEDHPIVELGITGLLKNHHQIQQSKLVSNQIDLNQLDFNDKKIHLFVLETNHHDQSLVAAVIALKSSFTSIRILAFTRREASLFVQPGDSEDFDGIVLKKEGLSEFEKAIAQMASGKKYLSDSTKSLLRQRRINITAREQQVLTKLLQGYSGKDIANQLSISEETVKSHRKNLMQKFSCNNSHELIRLALDLSLSAST